MENIYHKITEKIALKSQKMVLTIFLAVFALVSFAPLNTCLGYVTPDWAAQVRNNKKQEVKTKQVTVNYAKQKKNNKKQGVKSNKVKVNKKKQKKNNKKQNVKSKPYKYNRKAEIARNKLQEVN